MDKAQPRLAIPRPHRVIEVETHDGARILVRQHGRIDAPRRLVLSHGNGLAIDGYFPFWDILRAGYEVVVFDFRNHGQNPLHRREGHTMQNFVDDVERVYAAVEREWGSKATAGVFHSLSAVTAAMHSLRHPEGRWRMLALFDPPFYPCDGHPLRLAQHSDKNSLAERARRRTESYADPSELARQFRRPQFRRWVPGAAELMARATLRRDDRNGRWTLACPREFEAQVFEGNADPTLWPKVKDVAVPVKLVCGDPSLDDVMPPALIGRALAEEHGFEYEAIPDTTHFLQIERPVECVRAVEIFLRQHHFGE